MERAGIFYRSIMAFVLIEELLQHIDDGSPLRFIKARGPPINQLTFVFCKITLQAVDQDFHDFITGIFRNDGFRFHKIPSLAILFPCMRFRNLLVPIDRRFVVHWMKTPDRGYIHMTQICLIRHGQTDWNKAGRLQGQTNIPLNEAGRKQASECRDHLSGGDWDVMITTSLDRARETGEIINEKMGLPMEVMDEFMERGFGEGEGLTREERRASYEGFDFPGMETEKDLTNRIMAGLAAILQRYPNKRILLVSHGGVIAAILKLFHLNEQQEVKLFNGCINNLHYSEDSWQVNGYNVIDHLSSPGA
jgi:uncharacterized phosphatase